MKNKLKVVQKWLLDQLWIVGILFVAVLVYALFSPMISATIEMQQANALDPSYIHTSSAPINWAFLAPVIVIAAAVVFGPYIRRRG